MKDAGKSLKPNGKSSSETRRDRKSATGMSGSPKKGGHGGKFTWIGHGYSGVEIGREHEALDAKDPNFVDQEEVTAV
ncbi:programmed cell death protein 4-like [Senna tora]|uniref:Programmed cell death protein 4-like n=1 Tax=Senna tora TaxID=362788 RepID=A0A834TET4_9FABA|nr:programmed cell death protein 4-like [Senna tora]